MFISSDYLWIPIRKKKEERYLEVFCEGAKVFEFKIPYDSKQEAKYDAEYFASVPVSEFKGKELEFYGEFGEAFFKEIKNEVKAFFNDEKRPLLHFTANNGWINDPNGLVFHDGVYHLYFQFNPFNTIWANMLWGHATSRDLIHFNQQDPVLFPDEEGMVFSGSGIEKDGKLNFFYTAAGGTKWSETRLPVQKRAISYDGGMTLVKDKGCCVDVITKETRDPKVFWHEKSKSYIMVLYIDGNDFGIFRSEDLDSWEESQRLTLKDAWECPDLIPFIDTDGNEVWTFITADGYYYLGEFDGFQFKSDGIKHVAYGNEKLYAAQRYFGVEGRHLFVPWLKLQENGKNYCGAMGLFRELFLLEVDGEKRLGFNMAREIEEGFTEVKEIPKSGPYRIDISGLNNGEDSEFGLCLGNLEICYQGKEKSLFIGKERYELLPSSDGISMVIDYNILEVCQGDRLLPGAYLIEGNSAQVSWKNRRNLKTKIFRWEE